MPSHVTASAAKPKPRFIAPLHVFQFRGRSFAFFPRSGDLAEIGADAARAFARVERGQPLEDVLAAVHDELPAEQAGRLAADLEALAAQGLLTPELRLVDSELEADKDALLAHQPRNLMFFVTEACNLACTYCYEKAQGVHDAPRTLQRVDARRIVDRYFEGSPGRQGLTITFFGGEPLLNPKIIRDTVAYAKEKARETGQDVGFTMTSNLTLLTEEMADFLAQEKFHVMVSIDGDRESHDRHRRTVTGDGTYDTVVRNLKLLIEKMRAAGARLPKIRATLTAENIDPIATERHLRSLGTHLVELGETHGTVHEKQDFDVRPSCREGTSAIAAEVNAALERLAREPSLAPDLPPSIQKGLRQIHKELTRSESHAQARPKLCGVCRNMKAVTPQGDLYPCHRYVGMEAFKLGNVHRGGLDQEKVRGYYGAIYAAYAEKCAPCWLRHVCGGQCPWYLSGEDGSLSAPDDATCDRIRESYEQTLGLYASLMVDHPAALASVLGNDVPARDEGEEGEES